MDEDGFMEDITLTQHTRWPDYTMSTTQSNKGKGCATISDVEVEQGTLKHPSDNGKG